MDDLDQRIERAVLEGLLTKQPTLEPLVAEAVNNARAGYAEAERELAAAEERLAELLRPAEPGENPG